MACTFIREVTCDCCGQRITDLFGGYMVRRINDEVFDLCSRCNMVYDADIKAAEYNLTRGFFNQHGREPDYEME